MQECRARMPGCAAGGVQNRSHGWRGSKGTDRGLGHVVVPGVLGSSPHSSSTPTRGLSWGRRGSGQKQSLQPLQAVHSVAPARVRVSAPWGGIWPVAPCGSGVTGLSQGPLGGHRASGAEVSCLVVEGTSRARAGARLAFRPGHTAGGGPRLSPWEAPGALLPPIPGRTACCHSPYWPCRSPGPCPLRRETEAQQGLAPYQNTYLKCSLPQGSQGPIPGGS